MARAMQGSAVPVLLACVLLLVIAAPSFVAGKQNLVSGKHCQRTFRNCARCTPRYKECAVCEYGYKLDARTRKRCIADLDGPRCTRTFRKCVKCNAAFKSCRLCAYGFKLGAYGVCREDLSGHKCRKLFPNCVTCTPGFRACKRCARGFTLTGKTCKKTQTVLQPDDLSGPKCKALDAKCALCTTGFKTCAQCVSDYVIDNTTKKCTEDLSGPKCQSLFTNCTKCTPKFHGCATCAGSFILNADTKKCEAKKGADFTVSPAAGGSGNLTSVATISFPGNSFDAATSVHMEVVDDAVAEELYTETAVFFEPQQRGPSSGVITVTVGDQQPLKDPIVKLTIPAAVATAATSKEEARLMFLNKWESDIATLDTWEVTNDRAGPLATVGSITATLPLTAFYLSASGNYVASLLLVTTNTAPAGARRRRLLQAAVCDGVSLTRPVDPQWSIPTQGHFGKRNVGLKGASKFHRGLDFAVPLGTNVTAAIDGTVELRSQKGGKSGFGHYIIIRGAAGSTLYAHLPPHKGNAVVKNGDVVRAGEHIGVSGNSGTSTGPHLHFEYAPRGDIFNKSAKVDPEPCLNDTAVGSINFGDNGPVADDSFKVMLEGKPICQTDIGATNTCVLGALRNRSYTLSVTCLVAPDDIGTLGIDVLAPNMKIDGQSSLDDFMKEGETLTYTLTVT